MRAPLMPCGATDVYVVAFVNINQMTHVDVDSCDSCYCVTPC